MQSDHLHETIYKVAESEQNHPGRWWPGSVDSNRTGTVQFMLGAVL
jgi:hypothetical protein